MTNNEIIKYYENRIDDIENEDIKKDLLDKLSDIEDLLNGLDVDIDKELENQEADYLPSQSDYFNDFEACRSQIML